MAEFRRSESMSDIVNTKTLLKCFRDSGKSTATEEERAFRLLSRYPHPDQVREIRDQGVHPLGDRYNSSLLHYACRNGWYGVTRELVDKYQCDPYLKNRRDCTPLHCACEGGNVDIAMLLIC